MNQLIWLAFEESALSTDRLQQIQALSQTLQAQIVVYTDSRYADKVFQFSRGSAPDPDKGLRPLEPAICSSASISYQVPWPTMDSLKCDCTVVINDALVSKLNHPAVAALDLEKLFYEYSVCALLAPHSQRWLRTLSILSAAAQMQFIPNLCTRFLPDCARWICAGRVVEKRQIPGESFIGTLSLDEPSPNHGLWPISAHPLTVAEVAENDLLTVWPPAKISFEPFVSDMMGLDNARIVFAGGRGLGSKQNFDRLVQCAQRFGAAVAASRLAVDLGWCRNDLQVGQTGRAICPDVYIAFGISGAIQHLAGIKNAKKIIAINTDKDAPIFRYADYGVIADANDVIERLSGALPRTPPKG